MLKVSILISGILAVVSAVCPYANVDITPCSLSGNQIKCEGTKVTDAKLEAVFNKLNSALPEYAKSFEGFHLEGTTVSKIGPQVFGDIVIRGLIRIHNNPIKDVSFGNFPDLAYLDLSYNDIVNITSDTFLGLKSLRYLNLAGNQIVKIPKDTFSGMDNLERIDLSGNKLNKLTFDTFSSEYHNNIELSEVNLAFNELSTLPGLVFLPIRRPQLINLAHNKLRKISGDMLSFDKDVWRGGSVNIIFSSNGLKKEDLSEDTFSALVKLGLSVNLDLTYNNLTTIEEKTFAPLLKAAHSSVINVNNNQIKCGDCSMKWLVTDAKVNVKKSVVLDHCTDDKKRSLKEYTSADYKHCN